MFYRFRNNETLVENRNLYTPWFYFVAAGGDDRQNFATILVWEILGGGLETVHKFNDEWSCFHSGVDDWVGFNVPLNTL